jgi:DNA invertase Pin-like site-specific DNA recombinase
MLKDAVRRKFDVVMCWSVDRLARSLPDLVAAMQELRGTKVDLYLHQQALDTSTPSGRVFRSD